MKVQDLFSVLDKDVVFSVFNSCGNEVLFESNTTYSRNFKEIWDKVKAETVLQVSPTDHGELYVYISPEFMRKDD